MKKLFGIALRNSNKFMRSSADGEPLFFEKKTEAKQARAKMGGTKDCRVVVGPDHIHYNGSVK